MYVVHTLGSWNGTYIVCTKISSERGHLLVRMVCTSQARIFLANRIHEDTYKQHCMERDERLRESRDEEVQGLILQKNSDKNLHYSI